MTRVAIKSLPVALALCCAPLFATSPATITVQADKPAHPISPLLYGIFVEEINRAGDGGLYAEMLENRSFEDNYDLSPWTSAGEGTASLDTSNPLNPNNPTAARLDLRDGEFRFSNAGFGHVGLSLHKNETYRLSFYARSEGYAGPIEARLLTKDGKTTLASQNVSAIEGQWKQYHIELTASATDSAATLQLLTHGPGKLYLDMVSLFPSNTWKNLGLRNDLTQRVADMKPAFVRFPGGCFVEGVHLANAARWKKSIGDIAQRQGIHNIWGYLTTEGLGFHEYLLWCEAMGAQPLFVINCGMSHSDWASGAQLQEYVQDALDAIEYANGPVTSTWGAKRAAAGHPAPFNLRYMEIGNENGGPIYNERYTLFYDAIKAKYPQMHLIANDWFRGHATSRPNEIIDEHMYSRPQAFLDAATRYDAYDRKGPKIYIGEYAVTEQCGNGNLQGAIAEAAFMTGLERNSDVVIMASYAPLLCNIPWKRWNPNAINYDQSRTYATPSYYVQKMFASNLGDTLLPTTAIGKVPAILGKGHIGLGTWNTQAEYKDITVTHNGKTLFASDFSKRLDPWRPREGTWAVHDGVLRQNALTANCRIDVGDPNWTDYTLSLKARKIGGDEGFMIYFQSTAHAAPNWWNIGGWGNTQTKLQLGNNVDTVNLSVETGRWYDIRVELQGDTVRCFLDNKLIQQTTRTPVNALYATASVQNKTGDIIVKVANPSQEAFQTTLNLAGVDAITAGQATSLTGEPNAENSFETPEAVVPKTHPLAPQAAPFQYTFPPSSVTVLRLSPKR